MFFFFSKPPVFKVNIHNLSQFVNLFFLVMSVGNGFFLNHFKKISMRCTGFELKVSLFFEGLYFLFIETVIRITMLFSIYFSENGAV